MVVLLKRLVSMLLLSVWNHVIASSAKQSELKKLSVYAIVERESVIARNDMSAAAIAKEEAI